MRMLRRVIAFGFGSILTVSASWAQATWQSTPPTPVVSAPPLAPAASEYHLRLSGSNTIGSDLVPDLVKAWLAQQGAQDITVVQRRAPDDSLLPEKVVTAKYNTRLIQIEVKAHGSATGFVDLDAGATDIAMSSRPIKSDEAAKLARFGNMMMNASEHVVGLDGIAIIVPKTSGLKGLSRQTLKDIFAGRVSNWAMLGGPDIPITVYARDDKSGTFDTFKTLVLEGETLVAGARRFEDSEGLETAVSRDAGGIGFVALPYVKYTRALAISDGAAHALEPTIATIRNENYVLTRRLFLYTPGIAANPYVAEFVRFALSDDGQKTVNADGFVGVQFSATQPGERTVDPEYTGACRLSEQWTHNPNLYCDLNRKAAKIEYSFRFKSGATGFDERSLDNFGADNLERVLSRLYGTPNKTIILAGFADSSGRYQRNCEISLERAQAVADAIEQKGLPRPVTVGLCSEIPVRDNRSEQGRAHNRRVEIYLADRNIFRDTVQPPAPKPPRPFTTPTPPRPAPKKPATCPFSEQLVGRCTN